MSSGHLPNMWRGGKGRQMNRGAWAGKAVTRGHTLQPNSTTTTTRPERARVHPLAHVHACVERKGGQNIPTSLTEASEEMECVRFPYNCKRLLNTKSVMRWRSLCTKITLRKYYSLPLCCVFSPVTCIWENRVCTATGARREHVWASQR